MKQGPTCWQPGQLPMGKEEILVRVHRNGAGRCNIYRQVMHQAVEPHAKNIKIDIVSPTLGRLLDVTRADGHSHPQQCIICTGLSLSKLFRGLPLGAAASKPQREFRGHISKYVPSEVVFKKRSKTEVRPTSQYEVNEVRWPSVLGITGFGAKVYN